MTDATDPTAVPPPTPTPTTRRRVSFVAAVLMCAAVVGTLFPVRSDPTHNTQLGGDYPIVHARRIEFAKENLLQRRTLPGWYPREAMGTPFWANVQNFPFIPTRLILLSVPPLHAYTVGVLLASVLAALFTFLYARLIGLGPLGAAAAGWTFACAGTHVAHISMGALPMIEVYPALPLLLWLVELNFQIAQAPRPTTARRARLALAALAVSATCVALAGHPQLGIYALVTAGLYVICRGWGSWRAMTKVTLPLGLGVACAAFALWPMLLLVRRSTRAMPLALNLFDIPFPLRRLPAWVLPWRDGAPIDIAPQFGPFNPPPPYPNFYETVTYVGLLPLAAAALLVGWALWRGRVSRVGAFLAVVGFLALITALSPFHSQEGRTRTTFLRNPSRQVYVTSFALAMALGAGLDLIRRRGRSVHVTPDVEPTLDVEPTPTTTTTTTPPTRGIIWATGVAAAVLLGLHVLDVASHARHFIKTKYVNPNPDPALEALLRQAAGTDGRIGMDHWIEDAINRRIDDVGFFDSLTLARPYAMMLDIADKPPWLNTQAIRVADLPPDRVADLGVRVIVTVQPLPGLEQLPEIPNHFVYLISDAVPRAMFLPEWAAVHVEAAEIHRRIRQRTADPRAQVMLPSLQGSSGDAPAGLTGRLSPEVFEVEYARPSSDEIVIRRRDKPVAPGPGYVRVLESFDPGWQAWVNGKPVEVLPADDTFLAVAVPPGESEVRFTYRTPGALTGGVISLCSLALLVMLLAFARGDRQTVSLSASTAA